MICPTLRERVDELLDGLLPPEESHRLEVHASECAECAAELERAAKFYNFLDEDGREALEIFDATNLTQEVARRVARESVRPDRAPPAFGPPLRERLRWPLRLAAAAAVVWVALALPNWVQDPAGDVVLAMGERITLPSGERAEVRDGCAVQILEAAQMTLMPDQAREVVTQHEGAVLYALASDERLAVSTLRGSAVAAGSTYVVAIRPGGEVAVTVLSGRIHFEGERGRRVIRTGEQLVVDADDSMLVLSQSSIEELELRLELRDNTIVGLRGDLERREEELAGHRMARAQLDPEPNTPPVSGEALDRLPWKELARAARVLIPRSRGRYYDDPERMRAVAVFLQNAEKIQELTGERDPTSGLWHPAFIERMAVPFFDVLVPYASKDDRIAAAARVQSAAEIAHGRLAGALVPAEVIEVRLQLFRDIILAARQQVGDRAAADISEGMHIINRISSVRWRNLDDEASRDVAAYWGKHFDLVDAQRDALRPVADTYVNATLMAQAEVTAVLGQEDAESVLFPELLGRRSHRERETLIAADQRTDHVLRVIDAKLRLLEARIRFEREVKSLLRDDQISRGFGRHWGILTFRPDRT